jgi:cytoskeletal protein CcmA (bactofilin family)
MNTRSNFKTWLTAITAALALAACGGGGGGGGIDGTGGGGIDGTGVAYGTITAFGSVWVNGVRYNTDNASFRLDDSSVTQNDLRVGMVVRIDGSVSNATATTVSVDDAVKGRVESVLDANRLIVMGQTVLIDNNTVRANGVVPVVGDYLEVHGLPTGDGVVTAGYIERKTTLPTPPFAVKGLVRSHDTTARTFTVGTLTVNYSGAGVDTGDMPGGSWTNLLVDVKGTACAGNPVCGTLTASKVEPAGARATAAAQAEVEGFVISGTSADFMLGAQRVVTTGSTVYEGGVAADVLPGVKLEAEGSISNGVLTATKVSFRDNLRFEGDLASINLAQGTITLSGLTGITIGVTSLTDINGQPSLASFQVGDHVRVKARPGAGGSILALELDDRSADTRIELQGPVSTLTGTSITILGITVDMNTVSQFRNLADVAISRADFLAAATPGTLVKLRGDRSGPTVTWSEAGLED